MNKNYVYNFNTPLDVKWTENNVNTVFSGE